MKLTSLMKLSLLSLALLAPFCAAAPAPVSASHAVYVAHLRSALCSHDTSSQATHGVVRSILTEHPVLDGHIDLPYTFRAGVAGDLANYSANYLGYVPLHADLPRLRKGQTGGFFSIA